MLTLGIGITNTSCSVILLPDNDLFYREDREALSNVIFLLYSGSSAPLLYIRPDPKA